MEFIFTFEPESKIPYYHQLYQSVRQEIESGRIVTGTRLPSVHGLSDALKVSKTTVYRCWSMVMFEGSLDCEGKLLCISGTPEGMALDCCRDGREILLKSICLVTSYIPTASLDLEKFYATA
ncbi:GntR family transcriptional regulator [Alicyclobacillus sp. ALC3]|uniref:GntR family transcriptional regulator n=1 Tax=Alicyclobacillus sp. ALC3 TaxID=2796143 RepID=UPI00279C90BB|nr:GntR family transcriptional regulator [Alicyclobacillus sp. ALC3]